MCRSDEAKTTFAYKHSTDIQRLPIFTSIHEMESDGESEEERERVECKNVLVEDGEDDDDCMMSSSVSLETSKDSKLTRIDEEEHEEENDLHSPQHIKSIDSLFTQLLSYESEEADSDQSAETDD